MILMEFHNPEEWAARYQLLSLGYRFYNMDESLIPDDSDRVYLCYALPGFSK